MIRFKILPVKQCSRLVKVLIDKYSSQQTFSTQKAKPDEDFSYAVKLDKQVQLKERKFTNNENAFKPLIDDENYRELYKNFSLTITNETIKELDEVVHNEVLEGREYKYGLPRKNELSFNELIIKPETEETFPKTATEGLFDLLELDKDSSYESLLLKFKNTFNNGMI